MKIYVAVMEIGTIPKVALTEQDAIINAIVYDADSKEYGYPENYHHTLCYELDENVQTLEVWKCLETEIENVIKSNNNAIAWDKITEEQDAEAETLAIAKDERDEQFYLTWRTR